MREYITSGVPFTPVVAREIYEELPGNARQELGGIDPNSEWMEDLEGWDDEPEELSTAPDLWQDPHVQNLLAYGEQAEAERWIWKQERARERKSDRARRHQCEEQMLVSAHLATFQTICQAEATGAIEPLAIYLRSLGECDYVHFSGGGENQSGMGDAPWYFVEIGRALIRFIDRGKQRLSSSIAETAVTREMHTWLDLAQRERRAVRVIGNSRFGKSEFAKVWCHASLGLVRMVKTPDSNSMPDLLRSVAGTLGIEPWQTTARLRAEIEYVLKHSGIFLVFDEAHRLFPSQFTRTTAPARLEWVRHNIMDAGLGCAFIATPQGYDTARRKYLGKTGYTVAQFEERILKTVNLPEQPEEEDLRRIARIHLPALHEDYLALVVHKVLLARRSFVSDLEKVATLARHFAAAAKKSRPGLAELNAAIAEILPTAEPTPPAAEPRLPKPRTASCEPLATPAHKPGRRVVTPVRMPSEPMAEAGSRINFDQLDPAESPLGAPA